MKEQIKHIPSVFDNHNTEYKSEFITVKRNGNYYYAERKGIDSVAFVLFNIHATDEKKIGLLKEMKFPVEESIVGAFGGSIDDEKYHDDLYSLVIDEALEEAGFIVDKDDITYYGKYFVSTQMNQFCHLFGVTVDKFKQGLRTTTNPHELESFITWVSVPEVLQLKDWKTIVIVTKKLAEKNVLIRANKMGLTDPHQTPAKPI